MSHLHVALHTLNRLQKNDKMSKSVVMLGIHLIVVLVQLNFVAHAMSKWFFVLAYKQLIGGIEVRAQAFFSKADLALCTNAVRSSYDGSPTSHVVVALDFLHGSTRSM